LNPQRLRFAVTSVPALLENLGKPVEQGDTEVAFELFLMDSHRFGLQHMDDLYFWVFLQPLIELQFSRRVYVSGTIAEDLGFQWFHNNLLANFWIIQRCALVIPKAITRQAWLKPGLPAAPSYLSTLPMERLTIAAAV